MMLIQHHKPGEHYHGFAVGDAARENARALRGSVVRH